ncbi:MAG: CPBP family intramembrane metalloprotease [Patescibacteria group bacterium]|nr:CPBP family intramembrane metalloprotease [Patescibacteria group bacterium]
MKYEDEYGSESVNTRISYLTILLAIIFQFFLTFKYVGSLNPEEQFFGTITLIYVIVAVVGLFLTDPLLGQPFKIKPRFKKSDPSTFLRAIAIFLIIVLIQVFLMRIPLTIQDTERALAIVFAAPAEEVFFRGFLISLFIVISRGTGFKKYKLPGNREITITEIIGMIISSLVFAYLHTNYYRNPNLMLIVFISGLVLSFFFWYWRDLTANILAHMFLNIWVVGQYFWMVNF